MVAKQAAHNEPLLAGRQTVLAENQVADQEKRGAMPGFFTSSATQSGLAHRYALSNKNLSLDLISLFDEVEQEEAALVSEDHADVRVTVPAHTLKK